MKHLFLLFISIALTSCGMSKSHTPRNSTENTSLYNTFWKLDVLEGQKISHPDDPRTIGFRLDQDKHRISGFAGCNNFFGSYSVTGNKIRFETMASTKMACLTSTFNEQRFLNIFETVDSYELSAETLTLFQGSKKVAILSAESENTDSDIEGKHWKLKTFNGKFVKMEEDQEQEIFFTLKKNEGRISGFAGCNTFSGDYKLDGKKIEVSKVISTLRACPHLKWKDGDFIALFDAANEFYVKGDYLEIRKGDKVLAAFDAVYF